MSGITVPVVADAGPGLTPGSCRASLRQLACHETPCRLRDFRGGDDWPAQVQNLSSAGIGLLVDQPIEPGRLLFVELRSATGLFSRLLLLRIVRLAEATAAGHVVGGEFVGELSPDELRVLLS